ncbi:hypothetical protein BP5796_12189 [Coleophoma crateriformis]|uniref:Uncharacterized protein n=1 Tax=Coleophoma crateriformis TaxID=565419 RepID=A0A3D8QBN0_9HELO|nr:hypothetical protein BP5796_12189 [Coleophoma crateriformis]
MSDPFEPYANLFANPAGPGDARPTAIEVIQDNDLINKWIGKTLLITGATSGIGIETAKALFATGADIFITARDLKKGQAVIDTIAKSSAGKGKLEVIEMNMTSLESVKRAAKSFLALSSKLNILINNAGIMAVPELRKTVDGFEQHFGVNHLAHFTLTTLLLPTLIKSSTPSFNSRVISVTSAGHGFSTVHFDDINLTHNYNQWIAYGQSKTANIWLANYIDRIYGPRGVHANAVHPGGIVTPLYQHITEEQMQQFSANTTMMTNMKSPEQGAATTTWAAVADVWEGNGGKYLADCAVGKPAVNAQALEDEGAAPHAYDVEEETRLWELSLKLTSVKTDSQALGDKYSAFKSDFAGFVGSFSAWAKPKVESENAKLKKLEEELKGMQQTLNNWATALHWSAGTMVVGGIVAVGVLALRPVGWPLLILGGLGALALA